MGADGRVAGALADGAKDGVQPVADRDWDADVDLHMQPIAYDELDAERDGDAVNVRDAECDYLAERELDCDAQHFRDCERRADRLAVRDPEPDAHTLVDSLANAVPDP